MLAQRQPAEADYRKILRDSDALLHECFGTANSGKIVYRLHSGGITRFVDHLKRSPGAIFDRIAGLENQLVIHLQSCLTQGTPIALETLLPRRRKNSRG